MLKETGTKQWHREENANKTNKQTKKHNKIGCQKESTLSVKRVRCNHIKRQFWPSRRYSQTEYNYPKGNVFIIIRINKSIEELFNFLAISSNLCFLQRMSEWQSLSKAESHFYYSCQSKLQSYKMYMTGIFGRYLQYNSPQEKTVLFHNGRKNVLFFDWI